MNVWEFTVDHEASQAQNLVDNSCLEFLDLSWKVQKTMVLKLVCFFLTFWPAAGRGNLRITFTWPWLISHDTDKLATIAATCCLRAVRGWLPVMSNASTFSTHTLLQHWAVATQPLELTQSLFIFITHMPPKFELDFSFKVCVWRA